ncbi:MAG: D-glycerate dehydrogenase [Candidatus Heimdallarchaeota archaeon]|nr:D-glycerate dehydrogenase [Candidatus Heimdallarchaeota archaeon]
MSPLVILTHKIPEIGLNLLKNEMNVIILDEKEDINTQLRKFMPQTEYLISLLSVNVTKELINLGTKLKGIANYAVGYNNIDINAAREKNVLVTNTPDVLTDATADLVWALILGVTRKIIEADKVCRKNAFPGWLPEYHLGFEVTGKTIGIVGMGRIGAAVAQRAKGFDMKVIYHSRSRKWSLEENYGYEYYEELHPLLKNSDIVSLNLPYTNETHHLISKTEFEIMKPTSYLINTARGKIVNESDLVQALKRNLIAGAGLDVFYNEPDIPEALRSLKNVILTPHIGSATFQARDAMSKMVADNIIAIEHGLTPPNLIPEFKNRK